MTSNCYDVTLCSLLGPVAQLWLQTYDLSPNSIANLGQLEFQVSLRFKVVENIVSDDEIPW